MQLRVQTWKGKVLRVDVDPDATGLAVKQQLQILEGIPYSQQHLFVGGRELLDSEIVKADDELLMEIQSSHSALLDMTVPQPDEITLGEFNAALVQLGASREAYQDRLDQWQYHDLQIYPAVSAPPGALHSRHKEIELKRGPSSLTESLHDLATKISDLVSLQKLLGQGEPASETSSGSGFAWHPFLPKWALAKPDDTVWVHDLRKGRWEESSLVHKAQTKIRQIQWNPLSGTMLAVACEGGICLWQLAGRKSVTVLTRPGTSAVSSISWASSGRFLASTCVGSSQLVVWDVAQALLGGDRGITVMGPLGASLRCCLWAPRSQNILTVSRKSFRIWSRWKADSEVGDRWTSAVHRTRSPVVAAVWNSTGEILLVAQENSPLIHVVQSSATCLVGSDTLDVSAVTHGDITVGGNVQSLTWSPTSARLAVSFTSTGPGGDLIALFDTSFQHRVLSFRPIGFIRGPPHSSPDTVNKALHMEFAPNFDRGALLSIVWNGGQISTHPLYFAEPKRPKRARVGDDFEPKRG